MNKSFKFEFWLFSIYVDKIDFVWVYIIVGVMICFFFFVVFGCFDCVFLGFLSLIFFFYWGFFVEERGELFSNGFIGFWIKKVFCLLWIFIMIFV